MKISFDTNIYDKLYEDSKMAGILTKHLEEGRLEFYSTQIQEEEIKENKKPEDRDKVKWSLGFHHKWANLTPPLFSYGIPGAGYDSARWASQEEIALYNTIRPNSSKRNHHADRLKLH